MAAGIRQFGTTRQGAAVQAITLRAGAATATVLTFGAVLQDLRLEGVAYGLTLGSGRLADYEGPMAYHGGLIGPVANRIAGAAAVIAGRSHRFEANVSGGITLHSGACGTHQKVWTLEAADDASATLAVTLPDGEGGFPGTRRIRARFTLRPPATLRLEVTAETDAATLLNLANHSYWNLDGTPTWAGHDLRIAADHALPTDADGIPTGQIAPLAGGALDFRTARRIVPKAPPLDTCFCLSQARADLREVLWLTGQSGLRLTLATTEPGMQVYDGRAAIRPGHAAYEGLAFEPQFWPDAPHHPAFPSILLMPGETSRQVSEWRFGRA